MKHIKFVVFLFCFLLSTCLNADNRYRCVVATEPITDGRFVFDWCHDYQVSEKPGLGWHEGSHITVCKKESSYDLNNSFIITDKKSGSPVINCQYEQDMESYSGGFPLISVAVSDQKSQEGEDSESFLVSGGYGDDTPYDQRPGKPGNLGWQFRAFLLEVLEGKLPGLLLPPLFNLDQELLPLSDDTVTFEQHLMSDNSEVLVITSGNWQKIYRRSSLFGNWYLDRQFYIVPVEGSGATIEELSAGDEHAKALVAAIVRKQQETNRKRTTLLSAQVPGIISAMNSGSQGATGAGGGRGQGDDSFSFSPLRDKGKRKDQDKSSNNSGGDGQPPKAPKTMWEFMTTYDRGRISSPHLFAIGYGINPFKKFAHLRDKLKAKDVYSAASSRLLSAEQEKAFQDALAYHDAIVTRQTDLYKWFKDQSPDPSEPPSLYYVAQIQPMNWEGLAKVLGMGTESSLIKANYPSGAWLQQQAMFSEAIETRALRSWEQLQTAISVLGETAHQVPIAENRVIKVENGGVQESQVEDLDKVIKSQMRSLPTTPGLHISDLMRYTKGILSAEHSQVFMAALGLKGWQVEKNDDGSASALVIIAKADSCISGFNENHVALAAHVTGILPGLATKHDYFKQYEEKYGASSPLNLNGERISYYQVRQAVSHLLQDIQYRNIEYQKLPPDLDRATGASVSTPQVTAAQQSASEDGICCVCRDERAGIMFQPCMHLVTCKGCSKALSVCPICRAPIKEKIKPFML